ncbi:hypothetical protein ALQ35_100237 [Pseudomonas fluorescens]|nr:hypothetical protein ALQ35_100237 [Pseudomonas fluorescens]
MNPRMERVMPEQRAPYPRSADNADQMNLPEGKTCGDCVHCKRCTAMFSHIPADESCDWSPSRFREAVLVAVSA